MVKTISSTPIANQDTEEKSGATIQSETQDVSGGVKPPEPIAPKLAIMLERLR